ncbi:hypothetical protein M427DRAFT_31957 [Gonapodya prolifera JEL478]|uniref:TUG ubiquitin-like domain-containing protein n=1 Tax=Gonapodya prolifera (strain JEL478) TaxID=1344416 RepID=A0A139AHZ2_GONPJ|nr:hypothetical protein M427DRAFT_31957 [Gonapodya prolifera JEL478]|eukprot:KXS16045.1 hypothetical protein M427DRAFT_31957 [Gonapodya prolifera JEL478]
MTSNVVVVLPDNRRHIVKVTPSTQLSSIVEQVATKFRLTSSSYTLKHGKTTLDLSLPIRFANLASGAKLDLIPSSASSRSSTSQPLPAAQVNIALQLEEGGRVTSQFPSDTTLWDVLLAFERISGRTLNLTRRQGVPPKDPSKPLWNAFSSLVDKDTPMYLQPVLIMLTSEFASIAALRSTTLARAGVSSGSASLRLLYRFSDKSLQDAIREMEAPLAGVSPTGGAVRTSEAANQLGQGTQQKTPTASSPPATERAPVEHRLRAAVSTSAPTSRPSTISTSATPSVATPAPISPPAPSAPPAPSIPPAVLAAQSTSEKDGDGDQRMEDSFPQASLTSNETPSPPQRPPVSPSIGSPSDRRVQASAPVEAPPPPSKEPAAPFVATAQQVTSTPPEPLAPLARNVKIFRTPAGSEGGMKIDLPPSFFTLTPAELRLLLAHKGRTTSSASSDAPLMTKSLRAAQHAREVEKRYEKYPRARVRVRMPGEWWVQAEFWSSESASALYALLDPMMQPLASYVLLSASTHPPSALARSGGPTILEAGLAPSGLVRLEWGAAGEGALSEEWRRKIEEMPDLAEYTAIGGTSAAVDASVIEAQARAHEAAERAETEREERARRALMEVERETQQREREQGSGGGPSAKPKWFKGIGGR